MPTATLPNLILTAAGTTLMTLVATTSAQATNFVGDSISISGLTTVAANQSPVTTTVTNPGVEFNNTIPYAGNTVTDVLDFFNGGFTYTISQGLPRNIFFLNDVLTIAGIDSVDNPLRRIITNVTLLDGPANYINSILFNDSVGLDSGSISVSFTDFLWVPTTPITWRFGIETAELPNPTSVPEPTSVLGLLAISAISMGAVLKQKKEGKC
ncbi:PEP-CTERM sorting domain-containing protein [Oscillatoria sp. FACHB-1406]|uniref:PEP-CTERM sorting domain-containing protein n=1 Tax=Oscillatoria sp. FACHB-1406 TaxID=2692846 RepID=UPI001684E339|nr:PEP-CTERM sorting domain-containing protein [Oscillatoria sp. FACHB-1406]MBD2580636.1 PEP-CTERM sorting domain-containing protein [Oscillatoria sp. FACHB-1406]